MRNTELADRILTVRFDSAIPSFEAPSDTIHVAATREWGTVGLYCVKCPCQATRLQPILQLHCCDLSWCSCGRLSWLLPVQAPNWKEVLG